MALRHEVGWDPDFIRRSDWLWPLCEAAGVLDVAAERWPLHAELDAMFERLATPNAATRLYFRTPQSRNRERELSPEQLYDGRITLARVVPTRAENWHDLLNALCFATWPKSKLALHARQYAALCRRLSPSSRRLPGSRTSEQDALTIFDEGGAVIAATPAAAQALAQAKDRAFEPALRELCASAHARVVPFGHALFEHMVEGLPCPGASACVLELASVAESARSLLLRIDDALALRLADPRWFRAPREATHLRLQTLEPIMAGGLR